MKVYIGENIFAEGGPAEVAEYTAEFLDAMTKLIERSNTETSNDLDDETLERILDRLWDDMKKTETEGEE